jgi:uncharacterized membrane protein
MGYYLEVIGMLAVIAAWGTGYFFTAELTGDAGALRERHELFATLTLFAIIVATLFRMVVVYLNKQETRLKFASLSLFAIAFVLVLITGYLGGTLVMDFLIGI